MARPRKPTKVLDAKGAFAKNPQRRRAGEPEVTNALGPVPERLGGDQVKAWLEIVTFSADGVLTEADRLTVEIAACLLATFWRDPEEYPATKLARLEALLGKFGMTPADRAKLSIEKQKDENPFGSFG